MADQTMVVTELTRATGVVDITADANVLAGDAAGADSFLMPNDGQTFLICYANGGAGEVITFVSVLDQYGRDAASKTFTVATTKTGIVGPFAPGRWNNSDEQVSFKLGTANASSWVLAVRITQSNRSGE